jgi:hypothetical protein
MALGSYAAANAFIGGACWEWAREIIPSADTIVAFPAQAAI